MGALHKGGGYPPWFPFPKRTTKGTSLRVGDEPFLSSCLHPSSSSTSKKWYSLHRYGRWLAFCFCVHCELTMCKKPLNSTSVCIKCDYSTQYDKYIYKLFYNEPRFSDKMATIKFFRGPVECLLGQRNFFNIYNKFLYNRHTGIVKWFWFLGPIHHVLNPLNKVVQRNDERRSAVLYDAPHTSRRVDGFNPKVANAGPHFLGCTDPVTKSNL